MRLSEASELYHSISGQPTSNQHCVFVVVASDVTFATFEAGIVCRCGDRINGER